MGRGKRKTTITLSPAKAEVEIERRPIRDLVLPLGPGRRLEAELYDYAGRHEVFYRFLFFQEDGRVHAAVGSNDSPERLSERLSVEDGDLHAGFSGCELEPHQVDAFLAWLGAGFPALGPRARPSFLASLSD